MTAAERHLRRPEQMRQRLEDAQRREAQAEVNSWFCPECGVLMMALPGAEALMCPDHPEVPTTQE